MATSGTTATQSSTASSILTALGGSNQIDWNNLATNLSVAQFAGQTDRLNSKSSTLDKQITDAGNIKSALLSLSTSLGDRVRAGDLSPQPNLTSAVASLKLNGAATPKGTYSLEVTQLAKTQSWTSPPVASTATPVGSGTLTIRFGTVAGSSFTEDAAHAAATVTIPQGATLADVATALNAANAGISAYVANTTNGPQLVVKGQQGATNGFVIEAAENAAEPGLSQLAWNPSTGSTTQLLSNAQNAAYKLDGLPMSSASNSIPGLVAGLDATFTATNVGAPATLSFTDNTSAITNAMQDLTSALNELAGMVKTATDPLTGDLASDPGTRSLKRALSQLSGQVIMPNAVAPAPRTLADLGLSIQRDGTFALDGARLAKTLAADPTGVAAMFTNGLYGVYGTIDALNRTMAATGDANSLAASIARMTKAKTQAATDLSKLADKQEAFRQQLVTRFATTQTAVSASTSTLTFLKNQIDAWNSKTN